MEEIEMNTIQKVSVGKVKPYNSSYIYTLYACFDGLGRFKYFQYGEYISCYVDDILEAKVSLIACDIIQLKKIEKL